MNKPLDPGADRSTVMAPDPLPVQRLLTEGQSDRRQAQRSNRSAPAEVPRAASRSVLSREARLAPLGENAHVANKYGETDALQAYGAHPTTAARISVTKASTP